MRYICSIAALYLLHLTLICYHLTFFVDANNNSQPYIFTMWSRGVISHVTT